MSRRRSTLRARLWQSAGMLLVTAVFLGAAYGIGLLLDSAPTVAR